MLLALLFALHANAATPTLTFAGGQLTPAPAATDGPFDADVVKAVADWLAEKTYVSTLRVEGHVADGQPDAQARSERRALALARQLVAAGVDCKRLVAAGFGDTMPVAQPGDPANTRMALTVAALRGTAIGGQPLEGVGHGAGDVCR